MRLRACVDEYLIGEGLSSKTIAAYRYGLEKLLAVAGNIEVSEDGLASATRRCIRQLEDEGKSVYTVHQVRRTCGAFFSWLVRERKLEYNPVSRVRKVRLPESEVPRLGDEEKRRLLRTVKGKPRDYAIMCVLFDTMLRRGEVVALDVGDIDFVARAVRVRRGKGKKFRIVPVGRVALAALQRCLGDRKCGPLFLSRRGTRLSGNGLYRVVYRLSQKTGIKVYPHLGRHTGAQDFLDHGGNVRECQQILGHASIETTARYTGNRIEGLKRKYEVASPIDNLLGRGEQLL